MHSSASSDSDDDRGNADSSLDESDQKRHSHDGKFLSNSSSWREPFKSQSEPQLHLLLRQETFSVSSEPTKKTQHDAYTSLTMQAQKSDDAMRKNDEMESNHSLGDPFHTTRRVDPLVIFWGKSERRENVESTVIVKFILGTGEVFTHTFIKTTKVSEIKQIIADMFKVPVSIMQLKHNAEIPEDVSIADLNIERFGSVTFQLSSLSPDQYPLDINYVYPDIPTNDVLTVVVNQGARTKEVIVEIENRIVSKPFLGGYRHKVTGKEYHHAFTQTAPRAPKNNIVSRSTQTIGQNKQMNTSKHKITQTSEALEALEENACKILKGDPGRQKKKAEEQSRAFLEKVVLIQRNLRSWLIRKMMLKMKEEYKKCIEWENLEKIKKDKEKEDRAIDKETAMNSPQSKGDFELLYHNLEVWRRGEAERISNIESIAVRKAELYNTLETEIQIINSIEKHRIQRKQFIQKRHQEKVLEKTATPLRWNGSDGRILCMDSLGTQRAKEMRELYLSLTEKDTDPMARIKTLQNVKQTVLKFESALVPELVSLLDRESHILSRNLTQTNLSTLRERIQYLFLELTKDPAINPEAVKYLPGKICQRVQMYKCLSCENIQPYHKFSLHTKANDFRKCMNCCWLRSVGGPRIDINPVRHIMNAVRREELHEGYYTSVALIMQEQDFYHLIVNIWLAHSAIGGSGSLEELRLGRWDFTQDWSPWNCILLTAEELKAHLRFSNPEQIYSFSFVKKIKQRHQIGRIHFSELAAYSRKRTKENIRIGKMIDNYSAATVYFDKTK